MLFDSNVLDLIKKDAKRYNVKNIRLLMLLRIFYLQPLPGLKFSIVFRLLQHYRQRNRLLFFFLFLFYRHLKFKYGFDISFRTEIGEGLYIGHFGGVVIHGDSVIGKNCNLSQGVTIGILNHGEKKGTPIIGNEVFIGPNACVLGKVHIGNNVTIGANSVVTENVKPNMSIIAGKSTVVERDLSKFYIHNLDI